MDAILGLLTDQGIWPTIFAISYALIFYHVHDLASHGIARDQWIDEFREGNDIFRYKRALTRWLDDLDQTIASRYESVIEDIFGLSRPSRNQLRLATDLEEIIETTMELSDNYKNEFSYEIQNLLEKIRKENWRSKYVYYDVDDLSGFALKLKNQINSNKMHKIVQNLEKIAVIINAINYKYDFRRMGSSKIKRHSLIVCRKPFNFGLFEIVASISISYSIIIFLAQWSFSGDRIILGDIIVFEEQSSFFVRSIGIFAFFASVLAVWASIPLVSDRDTSKNLLGFALMGLAFLSAVIFSILTASNASFSTTLIATFTIAIALSIFASVLIAYAFVMVILLGTSACGLAENWGPLVVLAFYTIPALASIFLFLGMSNIKPYNMRKLLIPITVFSVLLAIWIASYLHFPGSLIPSHSVSALIIFLAVLPLLNGLADFASMGMTRWALRRGLRPDQPMLPWALFDFVFAVSMFALLGCSFLVVVRVVELTTGMQLIDLNQIFGDATVAGSIRSNPGGYWWLYATFLSTLLPTFVHLTVWISSLPITMPKPLRLLAANCLEAGKNGSIVKGRMAGVIISGSLALSVTIACALAWYAAMLMIWWSPLIGEHILFAFEWFARTIGALQ